jgi:hypothetical protein
MHLAMARRLAGLLVFVGYLRSRCCARAGKPPLLEDGNISVFNSQDDFVRAKGAVE